ncbi:MAG: hypothetical protein BWX45_00875 [Deltaproteobacteria bacterium ADurb.Bin002]|nr:MAG: hypothetical protein BWX45_00875 [Deltaproteobacteria bacterium ADurb.Bin002]
MQRGGRSGRTDLGARDHERIVIAALRPRRATVPVTIQHDFVDFVRLVAAQIHVHTFDLKLVINPQAIVSISFFRGVELHLHFKTNPAADVGRIGKSEARQCYGKKAGAVALVAVLGPDVQCHAPAIVTRRPTVNCQRSAPIGITVADTGHLGRVALEAGLELVIPAHKNAIRKAAGREFGDPAGIHLTLGIGLFQRMRAIEGIVGAYRHTPVGYVLIFGR